MSTYPHQYIYKKSFQLRRVRRNSGDARQGHAYVSFDSKHALSVLGVFVGDWLFVFPLCGFSLSLFCNYFQCFDR